MDGRRDEPETINVWELMSGLDDDDSSSPRPTLFPAIPPSKSTVGRAAATLATKLSMDPLTLEPADASRPKPHWKTSLLREDGLPQRTPIYALEDQVAHAPTFQGSSTELNSAYTPSSSGSSLFGSVSGSDMSSFENLADNLQRSLSFKLVFNRGKKDILGLEDPLFSNSAKDEFFSGDLSSMASNRRASEGDSRTPSESPLFLASARLMRWIKANKRALKLHRAMKGGSTVSASQEAQQQLKKPSPQSAPVSARPPRTTKYTISAGKVSDGASTSTASVSGSSRKPSDGSSSGKGSDDFAELNGNTARVFASSDQQRSPEAPHSGPVRRYRHSYSNGNPNKAPTEENSNPASMNRASSWEIEKVAVDASGKAVLYSTNARTDINAYEDSNAVRAILMSIVGSSFDEKSVSQNPDYEQDLKNALNLPTVTVPAVCVRGRCIAGIDDIMRSFKKGILGSLLLETLPHGVRPNAPCLCRGGKFLICPICKGKRSLTREGEEAVSCRHCIGTGLLKCPSCPKP